MRLEERLTALDEALTASKGRVPDDLLADARAVRDRAHERATRGDRVVLIGLCGGTGTGKSSLFNALAGEDLVPVGVRRPTTSSAAALPVGDREETAALLDWVGVAAGFRYYRSPDRDRPDGLVLVDMPDMDSVTEANQQVADRLIDRVDVLVWVVDPLKYAQRSLHEGYLARLRQHADVTIIALNHCDRLNASQRRTCERDLRRLVSVDGKRPEIVLTSAASGEGVRELRDLLAEEVIERRAVAERISADIRTVAAELLDGLNSPTDSAEVAILESDDVLMALEDLVGVERLADHGYEAYETAAKRAIRTPAMWLVLLAAGVLRLATGSISKVLRLALPEGSDTPARSVHTGAALSDLDIRHALSGFVQQARRSLPWFWAQRVADAADQAAEGLPNSLKTTLAEVPLAPDRRRWWRVATVLWTVTEAAAIVGLLWIVLARLIAWFLMVELSLPTAGDTDRSVPGLIIVAGFLAWLVTAVVRHFAIRTGARRHRHAIERLARSSVHKTLRNSVVGPLEGELDAYHRATEGLRAALA